jgi:hypothetical protein
MDACGVRCFGIGRKRCGVRRNRVVLAPRPWRQAGGRCPAGDGGKKRRSPGRARISRKAIARGKPGCLGCTCLIRVHSFTTLAHGAAGAVGARLSLRPLSERGPMRCKTRAKACCENESACPSTSLRGAKRRPFFACCASSAGFKSAEAPQREGGSNPAFLLRQSWIASLRSQ